MLKKKKKNHFMD